MIEQWLKLTKGWKLGTLSDHSNIYYVDQEEKKNISVPEIYAGIDLFAGLSCIHRSDQ